MRPSLRGALPGATSAGVLVLSLLAGACGGGGSSTATTRPERKGGHTFHIGVDARTEGFAASWIRFFPQDVTARPGDTIEFRSQFTGEPHSVAFGTLVAEYVAASAKVDPSGARPTAADVQAVLDKVPLMVEEGGGPGAAFVQAAAQPCYAASDDPPVREPCAPDERTPPAEVDGRERFLSSGFLTDGATATFKLADDMAPGVYTFMCLVHGAGMTAEMTVLDRFAIIPTPEEVAGTGRKELEDLLAKVKPDADRVQASTGPEAPAGGIPAGEELPLAGLNVFPSDIAVKAGRTVTWTLDGFHAVAFNAPEDARPWLQFDGTGALVPNPKSFTPAASPEIPVPPRRGGGGGPPPVRVDAGTWDGQGFHSSGALFSGGPLVYSLAFSVPGTYRYLCLVHPDMEGTVTVT